MAYFTIAELRALPDMGDATRFPDARLQAAHDWIVAIIERECDTSFVPTTVTERLTGGGSALILASPYVRSITSVTVDGTPLVVADDVYSEGALMWLTSTYPWSGASRGNITVVYQAGYSDEVPDDLKEAALRAARNWVLTMDAWSGVDERSTSINSDYGTVNLSTASPDGRPTGLPLVDTVITSWARRVRVPKVS